MIKKQDSIKEESIFTLVHKLREPLTSIRWCSEMLLSGNFGQMDKYQSDLAKEIYDGTNRLNEVINSLPNIAKVEIEKDSKE